MSLFPSAKRSKSRSKSARIFTPAWGLGSWHSHRQGRRRSASRGFQSRARFLAGRKTRSHRISQGDGKAAIGRPLSPNSSRTTWPTGARARLPRRSSKALPILGKDGTLAKIQVNNPGAGHVFAKTGTFGSEDKLNGKMMLNGKGLAASSSPQADKSSPSPPTSIT